MQLAFTVGDVGLDQGNVCRIAWNCAYNFQRDCDNVKFNLRLEFETLLAAVVVAAAHFAA